MRDTILKWGFVDKGNGPLEGLWKAAASDEYNKANLTSPLK